MKMHLTQISSIQLGFSFRSKIESDFDADLWILQPKDFYTLPKEMPPLNTLIRLNSSGFSNSDKYSLLDKDLIFRSRGARPNTILYKSESGKSILLASPLMRIRVTDNRFLPEYLAWYLNSPPAQQYFAEHAKGQTIQHLDKKTIHDTEIPVIPLEKQRSIVELSTLINKEHDLRLQITNKLYSMQNEIVTNYISSNS